METSFNSSFHSSSTSSSSSLDLLVVRISCQSKNRFLRLLIILSSSSATTLLCLLLHYRVLLHISIQISITSSSSSSSFSSYDGNHNHNNNPQSQKPAGGGGSGGGVVGFEVITEEQQQQQSNPMGKRRLYKCKHPIDALPFEAYYEDSWKIVRSVKIDGGNVTMHIRHHDDDDDDEFEFESEEKVPIGNLRLKSRKAVVSDCTCFLRPGIDICVLVTFTNEAGSSSSDEEDGSTEQTAWIDAKINSIERKPHKLGCDCRFFVNFYTTYQPNGGMGQSKPEKEITEVTIDNVFILQQLERKPCEDGYYRWCSSEDCSSTAEAKLYRGQFSYDISWFLVTSTLKGFKFKIISTQKKMVYQLDDCSLSSENVLKAINFQREDGAMKANIRTFVPEVPIKTSTPTNTTKLEPHDDLKEKDICDLALYDLVELRRSNRRNVQPERFSGYGFPKPKSSGLKRCKLEIPSGVPYGVDECVEQKIQGEKTDDARCFSMQNEQKVQNSSRDCADSKPTPVVTLPMSGSPTGLHLQDLPCDEVVVNHLPKISKIPSQHGVRSDQAIQMMKILGRKCRKLKNRLKEKATHNKLRSKSVSFSFKRKQSDDSGRTYERKNLCSSECVKVIDSFMKSIKADIVKDQPTSVFHWETIRETVPSNRWRDLFRKLPEDDQIQGDELEDLWKEMEVSTNVLRGLEETPLVHAEESNEKVEQSCQHEPELDEEIGIICQLCGSVITEIRYVSLPFLQSNGLVREREQRDESKFGFSHAGDDNLNLFGNLSSPKNDISVHKENDTVWALIPDLKNSLQIHQKKAFEFLWRHIAGSLIPAEMESMYTKTGGCVISHSPGAGKTFLVISFLVSSLRLFPRKRPLILAPNTTLYAWEKEIKKWEVSFPVYQIYTEKNYQDKKRSQIVSESPGHRRLTRVMMHAIDCLDKLRRWHEGPSILLMSYSSFHAFMREKSKLEHWRYMTRVLQQSPGILILDEGHNPRSTKSLTRKELMKVKTGHRILLSGTLFQNTFEEFFNTLCLARPSFISEVLRELDPRYRIGKKGMNNSREKRARKFFLENIAQRINSKVEKDRDRGLSLLKKLTNDFVDVYEGAVSDRLPGLEAYTLLIKPTVTQNEVLSKLQRKSSDKRYQIEMEILITVASIHPSLIKKLAYVSKYLSVDELEELEKLQSDVKKGSKVRFVLNLVQRCVIRKEKVLIFCRNLSPMNLLVEIFENIFGWKKGDDVLVMHGDQNLLERATVIDKFEERYGVSKVLVASIAACSEGISLTAASRVVLLDSEWNPSKTKQAVARAYRPGQEKVVYVYQLLSSGTMEEEKYRKTAWKTWVSRMIFEGNDVEESSRRKAENIDDDVLREIVEEDETKSIHMIIKDDKLYNGSNQGWN